MNHGDLEQDLIHNIVMTEGMTDVMIEEMTGAMTEEMTGAMTEEMTDAMTEETTHEMIDEDILHNKRKHHLHQHLTDGQKEILKHPAVGEQLKRNDRIRKL